VLDANLAFGPFLPTDQLAVKDMVVGLVAAKLLSRSTGMRLMQEAGIDIESIEDELDAVRRLDFDGASMLGDAVNSDRAARLYLGLPDEPGDAEEPTGGASDDADETGQPVEPPAPPSDEDATGRPTPLP
jgi:hypothetical protein